MKSTSCGPLVDVSGEKEKCFQVDTDVLTFQISVELELLQALGFQRKGN